MLLADLGGLRPWLSRYGIALSLQEISEVLGNLSGSVRQGAEYNGVTQVALSLDSEPALGWSGGTFYASALQIHGRNLSADNLLGLQTPTSIQADRATRLWELWYDQKFLGQDRFDVKLGQLALDQEFITSKNASVFIGSAFGWTILPAADLPGGGPAYPLASLGVRARLRVADPWTVLVAAANGSPAASHTGNPQLDNLSGTGFPLNGGVLAIAELQYAYPPLGAMLRPGEAEPLGGLYKLGFWYDSEKFPDLRRDNGGLSLTDPASTGIARMHRGTYAVYAIADRTIWQDPEDSHRNVNGFFRVVGTPQTDRNLIDFSLNAGLTMHEPIAGREDDTIGIGFGYAHVSGRAAALDRDVALFSGAATPVRGGESFIEVTYRYQVAPWWQLQPDFQYFFNPGGGIANPNAPATRLGDEAVLGLRTIITF